MNIKGCGVALHDIVGDEDLFSGNKAQTGVFKNNALEIVLTVWLSLSNDEKDKNLSEIWRHNGILNIGEEIYNLSNKEISRYIL